MEIDDALVAAIEWSEAAGWCEGVEALASVPGNPAGARVDYVAEIPIPIVAASVDGFFNCVLGLGTRRPAGVEEIIAIDAVYAGAGLRAWSVTVPPTVAAAGVADILRGHGLTDGPHFAKAVRDTRDPPRVASDLRVERIGPRYAADFAAINVEAWGMPPTVEGWFSCCVGRPGWAHYICFDADDPVAAGALFVRDGLGWLSWAATRPTHRGRGAQGALISRRIADAARAGCSIVHSEVYDEPVDRPSPSLRNLLRAGFSLAYRRPSFESPGSKH